jgi:hypothetical protein
VDLWLPVCDVAAEDADDAINPTFDPARKVIRALSLNKLFLT